MAERIDAHFAAYVDDGRLPGWSLAVARGGKVAHLATSGRRDVEGDTPVELDTIFRIYSMTKPITSVALMQLYEQGRFELKDRVARYLPEFADMRVYEGGAGADMVTRPAERNIRVWHLLTHTAGLTYGFHRAHPVDERYREHGYDLGSPRGHDLAAVVRDYASMPLLFEPGAEWNYSRSTDILGRIVEVVSGRTLGEFLTEHILAPLQMTETGFHTSAANTGRLAEAFEKDPWSGEPVKLFDMTENPAMESGGGGLVSTTMDYARFCQMLLNGGTLDGVRILGRKTLSLMASNHLTPDIKLNGGMLAAGHGFGLGFAVRTDDGLAPYPGSAGQFYWSGIAGTFFWIDPKEELFAVMMSQGPGQREYMRTLVRGLVYAAVE